MTTSLLGLYQQDVQSSLPALTAPAARVGDWIDLVKDYSDLISERYARAATVSSSQKKIASSCLYLAVQSLQIGASIPGAFGPGQANEPSTEAAPSGGKETVFAVIMLCLGAFNLWLGNGPGVISVLALLVLFVHFHWRDIAILNGAVPWQRGSGKARGGVPAPTAVDIRSTIESIVRRTDDIVAAADRRPEAPPPPALKPATLEFFQDILEAKLSDDKDYAFKKISRTIGQVLAAEGIGLAMDAATHQAMFQLDTIVDKQRASQFETIRPALMQDAKCLLPGYARRFVAA